MVKACVVLGSLLLLSEATAAATSHQCTELVESEALENLDIRVEASVSK